MRLENSFEVAVPPEAAWRLLNDVPSVLPCMPGAELVEVVSENAWKARLRVKLGPIALQFVADVARTEIDEAARSVVLTTKAREAKGRGSAEARILSSVVAAGDGTKVDLVTDLELRGAVAQHGRGVVAEVAAAVTRDFAACLERRLAGEHTGPTEPDEPHAAPAHVNGLRLLVRALLRSLPRPRLTR